MPSGGPVVAYTVTQSPSGQSQAFLQQFPQAPQDGRTPTQIVQGFITASGTLGAQQTAREYLTPQFSKTWNRTPQWSAIVYSNEPIVELVSRSDPREKGRPQTAVVSVTGTVQADLLGSGSYAVPSAKKPQGPQYFDLVEEPGGQWRINSQVSRSQQPLLHQPLLLTSYVFSLDYQPRNLYFLDPGSKVLVPDPVYVPLQATAANLMFTLVNDLNRPPGDWLSGATHTAFPPGTKVSGVTLAGQTATVNLTVASLRRASAQWQQQVTSQLLSTLVGSGQGGPSVQTVELVVNGKPWIPPNAQDNPVQGMPPQYNTPQPVKPVFYYLNSAGYLMQQRSDQVKPSARFRIGKGYTAIAVSRHLINGVRYLAALRGGTQGGGLLFTGPVGGKLVPRGNSFTSISWGLNDDLWATAGDQIYKLQGDANPQQPAGMAVPVNVVTPSGSILSGQPFDSVRVAPDGVQVAIIVDNGSSLDFGAISTQQPAAHAQASSHQPAAHPAPVTQIVLSPFFVDSPGATTFSAVSWYGPYNVITLGTPGPLLTEYPVNGGGATVIQPPPSQILSITASLDNPLIAGLPTKGGGEMSADPSLTGTWTSIPPLAVPLNGFSPVYPG
jgi:hypothetical protein